METGFVGPLPTAAVLALCAGIVPAQVTIAHARLSSAGVEANADTPHIAAGNVMAVSAEGRCVTFVAVASNLVPGDSNNISDVFVRDVATGTTERINVSTAGAQMLADKNGRGCFDVAMSADGRYIAFSTSGTKLIDGEKGGGSPGDIYLRDRHAGTTQRVSLSSSHGTPNGDSWYASVSSDAHYVAFYSLASNLVANDRNRVSDVFVRDLVAGTTTRANLTPSGGQSTGRVVLGSRSISGTSFPRQVLVSAARA